MSRLDAMVSPVENAQEKERNSAYRPTSILAEEPKSGRLSGRLYAIGDLLWVPIPVPEHSSHRDGRELDLPLLPALCESSCFVSFSRGGLCVGRAEPFGIRILLRGAILFRRRASRLGSCNGLNRFRLVRFGHCRDGFGLRRLLNRNRCLGRG